MAAAETCLRAGLEFVVNVRALTEIGTDDAGRILERQLRGDFGEIDLIALDADTVVFVEVKTRSTTAAGDPTEAITPAKQRKMTQSALAYLKRRGWLQRRARFDVVAIVWDGEHTPEVRHFRNAFEAFGTGQMYS